MLRVFFLRRDASNESENTRKGETSSELAGTNQLSLFIASSYPEACNSASDAWKSFCVEAAVERDAQSAHDEGVRFDFSYGNCLFVIRGSKNISRRQTYQKFEYFHMSCGIIVYAIKTVSNSFILKFHHFFSFRARALCSRDHTILSPSK